MLLRCLKLPSYVNPIEEDRKKNLQKINIHSLEFVECRGKLLNPWLSKKSKVKLARASYRQKTNKQKNYVSSKLHTPWKQNKGKRHFKLNKIPDFWYLSTLCFLLVNENTKKSLTITKMYYSDWEEEKKNKLKVPSILL